MKKVILTTAAIAMAMLATNALAQNVTTVALSAEVPQAIQLGTLSRQATVGTVTGGSDNNLTVTFAVVNSAITGGQAVNFDWLESTVSINHKLKIATANNGLAFQGGTVPDGFRGLIGYDARYFWAGTPGGPLEGASLDTGPGNTIISHEVTQTPKSNTGLRLGIYPAPATGLAAGTYSDTLTATITPTP